MSNDKSNVNLYLPKPTPKQNQQIQQYVEDVVELFKEKVNELRPWRMVREFHRVMGQPVGDEPQFLPEDRERFRMRLIEEELTELYEALTNQDLPNTFKEMADLIYVIHGLAVEMGGDLDSVFDEVHRSNMTKIHPDGKVHYREDGKVLKPDTYEPADIQGVLF